MYMCVNVALELHSNVHVHRIAGNNTGYQCNALQYTSNKRVNEHL